MAGCVIENVNKRKKQKKKKKEKEAQKNRTIGKDRTIGTVNWTEDRRINALEWL